MSRYLPCGTCGKPGFPGTILLAPNMMAGIRCLKCTRAVLPQIQAMADEMAEGEEASLGALREQLKESLARDGELELGGNRTKLRRKVHPTTVNPSEQSPE